MRFDDNNGNRFVKEKDLPGGTLRVALCEDDREQSRLSLSLLDEYRQARPGVEWVVHTYFDGDELLARSQSAGYDLYLLDILLPGQNGIEVARCLRTRDEDAVIIFLTSSADYALEAFNVSAAQYLLKPVARDALFTALDKAMAARERDEGRFIMLATKERMVRVPFSSIICVELSGRALRVTLEEDTLLSRTVREPFASAIAPLLEDSRFLHAHKSFVLNMARVRELTAGSFIMTNGCEIPIPRNKFTYAKNRYFDYLSARGIGLLGGINHAR